MEYSETITRKKGLFDRLMGRPSFSGVVAANQIITVWGAQGGVGCSSISAVVAKMLHQWGFTVLIVEASPTGGSFLRFMGKKPVAKGLDTLSRGKEQLSQELESIRVGIVKGLSILPRSGASYNAQWFWQEDEARELYHIARRLAAFVVVDAGHVLSDALARAALSEADHIISVFRSTPVGLDSAARFHEHCHFGKMDDKVLWVMNQAQKSATKTELEFLTGEQVAHTVLWDKNIELLEQGGAVPRNLQGELEDLLQEILRAPSARVF